MARRRSGKKIDFVHWTGIQNFANTLTAGSIGGIALPAQYDPETWLRFRGNLLAELDGTMTPGVFISVAVGLILVLEATATTVLWSPASDPDAPWLYYSMFTLGYEEAVTDVVGLTEASVYRETIDDKAMRIVRNQEVQFVVENVTLGGTGTVNVSLTGRALSGT